MCVQACIRVSVLASFHVVFFLSGCYISSWIIPSLIQGIKGIDVVKEYLRKIAKGGKGKTSTIAGKSRVRSRSLSQPKPTPPLSGKSVRRGRSTPRRRRPVSTPSTSGSRASSSSSRSGPHVIDEDDGDESNDDDDDDDDDDGSDESDDDDDDRDSGDNGDADDDPLIGRTSKRKRKSRLVNIGGFQVLRTNNYNLEDGYVRTSTCCWYLCCRSECVLFLFFFLSSPFSSLFCLRLWCAPIRPCVSWMRPFMDTDVFTLAV